MAELDVDVFKSEDAAIVRLKGELDIATASRLRHIAAELPAAKFSEITIDLTDVTFIDSVGLSVVIALHKRISSVGGSLILQNPSARTRSLIEISGLSDYLVVRPSSGRAPS
jgi:anti-sigma B factor antagonist